MKATNSNFQLTYCTNIHPGEEWQQVFANLEKYVPDLKTQLAPEKPFGIGLRLADVAARQLLKKDALMQFKTWLIQQELYVFTLNGFPYGGFHHQVVKDQVYAPDWSKRERLDYTLRLVKILTFLLPEGMDGGISTLPLSYKPWFKENKSTWESTLHSSSIHLALVAAEMARIREETGKLLHVDLEPEPDGLIENSTEVIDFFQNWLLPIGGAFLAKDLAISQALAEQRLLEHIRVCYDTCHFAVEYEDPLLVFKRFQAAGIQIGKVQISAALRVMIPQDLQQRSLIVERLRPFAESTYLHQVIERRVDGTLHHYPDLVTALPELEKVDAQEWRIHFHVPIFIRDYQLLHSTQDDIIEVLDLLGKNNACEHLEIETYTWDVLPSEMKMDLLASIQREYEWVLLLIN
ncbi:MAG TPA: xylose isomerase [Cyanobacteria bacterium UBA11371]|nr:xylose isomerase [Cyanobacteria bacterium UBA11371]HBE31321.1 xylose isomerase [Cyanobacteria bacterium UBA11368]